ncbi:hypothetical protein NZD89_29150 (plasmid) [Alicyclobacillus fastidiosus]|uniref:Uncharacterized protein n=1 Tax=Alicyclobacillus fastidiosus TaxID=392011 RepID=A0ABY6ZQ66_9BACL|nr:hypothetical protein [Alicyclobacillus fastidiosus]WAH44982.1 hypothetical protein NZD89_29150 [Alicyclobacillus fastidiosus]GMA66279.1 hypothetical protein GCM10025859_67210 [Alicyclobacillus fastidiosus]GMA66328.1 hypothetical protein GCM10025859_67700 [Alicyclobacillus fastidiosus]
MHPLYPVARRMVGRSVVAHHVNGRKYTGVLQSVTPSGIYLLPSTAAVSFNNNEESSVELSIQKGVQDGKASLVYAPAAYFGFGALTGLALGGLAGGYYW